MTKHLSRIVLSSLLLAGACSTEPVSSQSRDMSETCANGDICFVDVPMSSLVPRSPSWSLTEHGWAHRYKGPDNVPTSSILSIPLDFVGPGCQLRSAVIDFEQTTPDSLTFYTTPILSWVALSGPWPYSWVSFEGPFIADYPDLHIDVDAMNGEPSSVTRAVIGYSCFTP